MSLNQKELKQALIAAIEICREISQMYDAINFSSGEILKLGISLFIAQKRNGNAVDLSNGNGNGNGQDRDATVLNFGKYRGKDILEVLRIDREYISWLAENCRSKKIRELSTYLLQEDGLSNDNLSGGQGAAAVA